MLLSSIHKAPPLRSTSILYRSFNCALENRQARSVFRDLCPLEVVYFVASQFIDAVDLWFARSNDRKLVRGWTIRLDEPN